MARGILALIVGFVVMVMFVMATSLAAIYFAEGFVYQEEGSVEVTAAAP